jgi:hypothetical protein
VTCRAPHTAAPHGRSPDSSSRICARAPCRGTRLPFLSYEAWTLVSGGWVRAVRRTGHYPPGGAIVDMVDVRGVHGGIRQRRGNRASHRAASGQSLRPAVLCRAAVSKYLGVDPERHPRLRRWLRPSLGFGGQRRHVKACGDPQCLGFRFSAIVDDVDVRLTDKRPSKLLVPLGVAALQNDERSAGVEVHVANNAVGASATPQGGITNQITRAKSARSAERHRARRVSTDERTKIRRRHVVALRIHATSRTVCSLGSTGAQASGSSRMSTLILRPRCTARWA